MQANDENIEKIFQFYNEELNKYKAIVTPLMRSLLEEERKPHLKKLDALLDIYLFQNYLLDNQSQFFNKAGNQTLSLFFSKIAGDLFALRQTLMVGQLVSASSIERNIFETYIDTKLVLEKDTEERSKLFENFQHALLWNRITTYKKYLDELDSDSSMPEEMKKEERSYYQNLFNRFDEDGIKKNYEKIKQDYHPKYPFHWAWKIFKDEVKGQRNPSREFICKKLGLYNDYLHVYSTSSLAVHNQPLIANLMTVQGGISSVPIFSDSINSVAGISASIAIDIIILILKYAQSNQYDEISAYLNYFFKEAFFDE